MPSVTSVRPKVMSRVSSFVAVRSGHQGRCSCRVFARDAWSSLPHAEHTRNDEAVYSLTDCDPEMRYYGREVSRVIHVLRTALKDLNKLREDYRLRA